MNIFIRHRREMYKPWKRIKTEYHPLLFPITRYDSYSLKYIFHDYSFKNKHGSMKILEKKRIESTFKARNRICCLKIHSVGWKQMHLDVYFVSRSLDYHEKTTWRIFLVQKKKKVRSIYSRVLNNNHLKRVLQCYVFCFYCFNTRNTDNVSFVAL